jgi:hypothetical protein
MDVQGMVGEEMRVPIRARVLDRAHALGLAHDPDPRGTAGGVTLTSLRGMAGMVEGAEVGSEEVEGEVDVVDIVRRLGLVLHHPVGVLGFHADGRQATSVAGTEGAERGLLRTLCVLVARERDRTLVLALVLHVPARGRALCRTLPTRDTVEAGAGVAHVLDLLVVEGGATVKMTFGTVAVGPGHPPGVSRFRLYSSSIRFACFPITIRYFFYLNKFVALNCKS